MAGPRDKSTIPQGKDPLDGLTYRQPSPPINGLIADTSKEPEREPEKAKPPEPTRKERPPEPMPEAEPNKGKVTVVVPADLLERLRNAAWWQRKTLAALAEEGIRQVLAKLERDHGGPFQQRQEPLKPGRPQGSRNTPGKSR